MGGHAAAAAHGGLFDLSGAACGRRLGRSAVPHLRLRGAGAVDVVRAVVDRFDLKRRRECESNFEGLFPEDPASYCGGRFLLDRFLHRPGAISGDDVFLQSAADGFGPVGFGIAAAGSSHRPRRRTLALGAECPLPRRPIRGAIPRPVMAVRFSRRLFKLDRSRPLQSTLWTEPHGGSGTGLSLGSFGDRRPPRPPHRGVGVDGPVDLPWRPLLLPAS